MATAALQNHWMRRRKEFVITPTETIVRSENKLPKHHQLGNTYDLMRVTTAILQIRRQNLKLEKLLQFAHYPLFSSVQLKESNILPTLKHKSFYY